MTPVDWATRPLKKYADFTGRAPRADYWWYTLALIVAALVISIIENMIGLSGMVGPYGPLSALLMLALLVPGLAVTVRRLHDTNRSGWWILIALIPYAIVGFMMGKAAADGDLSGMASAGLVSLVALAGGITLLVFMILRGTIGDNRFGADPYAGDAAAVAA